MGSVVVMQQHTVALTPTNLWPSSTRRHTLHYECKKD
uniref:Uncharacterized protein n=1 Tax=Arundo donax TaxID=35708 RepID=A0A0A9TGI1_ARUDO